MATSIRLPKEIEEKLESISHSEHLSKSQIIKNSLAEYFDKHYSEKNSYELGKNYFGKYGTGQSDLSTKRKEHLKKIIDEKMSSR
ncbi:MAG: ribbon-helix-helix domain-containing protein [Leptospirales bacterium]